MVLGRIRILEPVVYVSLLVTRVQKAVFVAPRSKKLCALLVRLYRVVRRGLVMTRSGAASEPSWRGGICLEQ
jgi:hypothetical protein